MPAEQQFVVGQLYLGFYRNGLLVFSQPGGIGTAVFPQAPTEFPQQNQGYYQVPMTYPALYQFGCGHFLNCPEIYEVYSPADDTQVALVCCPICSWIAQIIVPYENYSNYEITPIVVA